MEKEKILEAIAGMTVLEVSELVKDMEEKFGVSAAAPVAVAAAPSAGSSDSKSDATDENATVNVILKEADASKKIPVIKEVRALTGLGLKDAKDLVEAGGKAVKEGIPADEAKKIKEQLEAAGAVIEIQ